MGDERPNLALVALALFAEAIGDRDTRRGGSNDPLQIMKDALAAHNLSYDDLDDEVKRAFEDLFDDLSYAELRMLGRLQERFAHLGDQYGLWESVEVGSQATLAKL